MSTPSEAWPEIPLGEGGCVYGPNASTERAARCSELVRRFRTTLGRARTLMVWAHVPSALPYVVVAGDVDALALMHRSDVFARRDSCAMLDCDETAAVDAVPRDALVAHLRAQGHATAADRVEHGPPDQACPPGGVLLVLALREGPALHLAVTWAGDLDAR